MFLFDRYYPIGGWDDYHKSYNIIEDAKKDIEIIITGRDDTGKLVVEYTYDGKRYDNYQLIDLMTGKFIELFPEKMDVYVK